MNTNIIFKNGGIQLKIDKINLTNSLLYFLTNDVNLEASINDEIERVRNDLILIDASIIAVENLKSIICIVRASKNEIALENRLQRCFEYTKHQANYIANIELNDLNNKDFKPLKLLMKNYLIFLQNAYKS